LLGEVDLEDALSEYYRNSEEIDRLAQQPVTRGIFGGLDEYRMIEASVPLLLLMARQCALKEYIHGRAEVSVTDQAFKEKESDIDTIGEFIDHRIGMEFARKEGATENDFLPVSMFTYDVEPD
jgi:hypothetical protein